MLYVTDWSADNKCTGPVNVAAVCVCVFKCYFRVDLRADHTQSDAWALSRVEDKFSAFGYCEVQWS